MQQSTGAQLQDLLDRECYVTQLRRQWRRVGALIKGCKCVTAGVQRVHTPPLLTHYEQTAQSERRTCAMPGYQLMMIAISRSCEVQCKEVVHRGPQLPPLRGADGCHGQGGLQQAVCYRCDLDFQAGQCLLLLRRRPRAPNRAAGSAALQLIQLLSQLLL
jgi:hypothetical protein